jgi:hypothetical protein
VFDVIAAAFGDSGTLVDRVSKTYTVVLTKEALRTGNETRARLRVLVSRKAPGSVSASASLFTITEATRSDQRISLFEVPNLKKERLVLSGVILDNIPYEEYQRQSAGQPPSPGMSDSLGATSLRQFKRGTVLSYGFNIYNAR